MKKQTSAILFMPESVIFLLKLKFSVFNEGQAFATSKIPTSFTTRHPRRLKVSRFVQVVARRRMLTSWQPLSSVVRELFCYISKIERYLRSSVCRLECRKGSSV